MTKNPVTINAAHLSGRFDAAAPAVARYIAACVREHDLDLVTTTECRGKADVVRKELGNGWWVRSAGEYLICGRWARITPAKNTKTRERRLTYVYSGHSSWRDTYVATQMCRVVDNGKLVRRVLVTAAHLPSGVERPGGMKANSQTRTHRLATPRWGRSIARRTSKVTNRLMDAAARGGNAVAIGVLRVKAIAGMDCNLNQHDAPDRDYMRRGLGMPGIWDRDRPKGGTHNGGRLIDTIHTTARIIDSGLVHVDPDKYDKRLDHGGIWAVLGVGKRGPVDHGTIHGTGKDAGR